MKTSLTLVSLVVLAFVGVLWFLIANYPDNSYEYGYAGAFVPANSQWMSQMPPRHVCEELAADGLKRDAGLSFDRVVDGCRHGYYDAVNMTRGRLGWPPMTESP